MDSSLVDASPAVKQSARDGGAEEARVCRKVMIRLVPLLFVAYLFCQLDRLNISFAQIQMKTMPGFGDAVYGLGAGLFFIAYMIFEVPSGLLLQRIGIRKTLCRIMVGWGLVSVLTALVRTPAQFYLARLLLGACEAGFFPGVVYYFSTWLPVAYRGRVIGIFMSAAVLAGVFGGPLAGFLMDGMHGAQGLAGWQWLLIVEGVPSIALGIVVLLRIDDKPADAGWLSRAELATLEEAIAAHRSEGARHHRGIGEVVRDPYVYRLAGIYFLTTMPAYGLGFWTPQIIQSFGVTSALHVGLYAAIPSAAAFVSMILLSRHSDRKLERRWHYALPAFVGAAALVVAASRGLPIPVALGALSVAYAGLLSVVPVFWPVPTSYLGAGAAASGIAFINTLGVCSGFVAPVMFGFMREATGSLAGGLLVLAACACAAGSAMLAGVKKTLA
ncbi:MFS transporter [Burkholderia sp. IDO3]|uniref:MFS transporter n=1 Tax=Burkholderia sp. IDO3 TaxID=1705310 RepID=UPI000BBA9FE2|nr:MFS transporter [Burkholderia sp. IDO3]AXK62538.1 MFS transporter [Burkholderia sp. IDO3]PCD63212.1 MFS transporter [Burkholderia sp. IDO3]